MKPSLIACLFLICATALFLACGRSDSAKSGQIVLEEKTENAAGGVVLKDESEEPQSSEIAAPPVAVPNRTLADRSELQTTFDGYGNKTETRSFKGHPRLDLVAVTTAVDGTKRVMVYGYEGELKRMPDDFAEKALTASATEIANAAEFKALKPYQNAFVRATPTPAPSPLRQPSVVKKVEPTPSEIQTEDQSSTPVTENDSETETETKKENRPSDEENHR
jgi:hypothetical protein